VVATGQWFNWSIGGAILLLLLFRGSADFSEEISASKYPKYLEYQENVPRFIPNIFRRK
jgi:steroid 5-alpha reductase family enzyme